jgi:hypothetical protein
VQLSDAQRDVLTRLAEGQGVYVACIDGANVYRAGPAVDLDLTDSEMVALENAGLVEYDELDPWMWRYTITDAGRAALGEGVAMTKATDRACFGCVALTSTWCGDGSILYGCRDVPGAIIGEDSAFGSDMPRRCHRFRRRGSAALGEDEG